MNSEYDKSLADSYDSLNDKEKYKEEVEYISSFLNSPAKILDVGCGTGTHAFMLSDLGHLCVGIDISKEMIEVANRNNKSKAEFHHVSIEDFLYAKEYDLCISLFNVINHILTIKDLRLFFESVYYNLKDDGLFIFDCFNSIAVLNDRPVAKQKGSFHIKPHYDPFTGILKINYIGDDGFSLTHRIWDVSILIEILREIGFDVRCCKRNTQEEIAEQDYKITFICRRK